MDLFASLKRLSLLLTFLSICFFSFAVSHLEGQEEHEHSRKQGGVQGTPQLKFIQNEGQWEKAIQFRTDLPGGRLWLQNQGFTYSFQDVPQMRAIHDYFYHGDPKPGERPDDKLINCHAFQVDFLGSNPDPDFSRKTPTDHYYNFYQGNQPDQWKTGLRAYDEVSYHGLYAGIDMKIYSQAVYLKYDFLVEAGADPAQIQLQYTGQESLSLKDGDLHIQTSINLMQELKPYSYQIIDGEEREVKSRYVLQGNVLSFEFPEGYDQTKALVIDPTLVGATYSGSTADCYGHTATYDDAGNIYSGGICFGQGFPVTTGAFQTVFGGNIDQAINKYSADASALIWSTYIGGSSADYPHSLFVNGQDELIVMGSTSSMNFPVSANAFDSNLGGSADIVLTHLNPSATAIIGSTYLGGGGDDGRNTGNLYINYGDTYRGEVIVDDVGDIYVASVTTSFNFPVTANAYQGAFGGGRDGIVVKMSPDLSTEIWGTYIGGPDDDNANSLKLTSTGEIYVAGIAGVGFPTTAGAYQTAFNGGDIDGYLAHLSPNGQTLVASTYLGTSGDDASFFVEIDINDIPYVLGESPSYPVSGSVYSQAGGELFITKLDAALTTSNWSTVIGGGNSLSPTAFLVDNCGNIYSSSWGSTVGLDFTPNAYDPVGGGEFYLCVLNPDAASLLYATSFGADSGDHVDGGTCRFDKRGVVYESVCTATNAWPVTANAVFPTDANSGYDVTCFKFEFNYASVTAAFASINPMNGCAPYPLTFVNNSTQTSNTTYFWDFGDGNTSTDVTPTHTYLNPGIYNVMLIATDIGSCTGADTAYSTVTIGEQPFINPNLDTTTCAGNPVTLSTQYIAGATYDWSPGATLSDSTISNPVANPTETTVYTLIIIDQFGCSDTADVTVGMLEIVTDAGPPVSFCEGEGGAQLEAGPITGGATPYYYTWWCDSSYTFCGLDSINDNDPIANPDSTTWYYLQVVDANGCVGTIDSAQVTVTPKPIVDAGPDAGICQQPAPGTLLQATVVNSAEAPGPYIVEWTPHAGLSDPFIFTPYARPDTTTIYTCVVISSNGCSSAATTVDTLSSITVTVHPQPIADAGPEIHLCYGESIQIAGIGHSAGPDYTFEWSPTSGLSDSSLASPTVSPELTTEYILNVWSNGCPSIGDPVTVWVHTLPTPSAGNIGEICLGDSAQLDAFADGDSSANYTYNWWPLPGLNDHNLENPLASPDSTDWYYLVATSSWGCESELDSVQVTVIPTPVAEAGPNLELCAGDSLQLQGSYYYTSTGTANPSQVYYTWSPDPDLNDPHLAQPWVIPSQSDWYYLTIDHSTCSTLDSTLITVNPQISPLVYADTTTSCEGDSVQLHASGGLGNADFSWFPTTGLSDPFAAEPMAAPGTSTTYVLLAAEGACSALDSIELEIIPLPDMAYLSSLTEGCAPFTVNFLDNSSNVLNYVWDFGDGSLVDNEANPEHEYDAPGTYQVSLTGVNTGGCSETVSSLVIQVVEPTVAGFGLQALGLPDLTSAPMELYMPSSTVEFTDKSTFGPLSWYWDFGDGTGSELQNPVHSYREEGVYMVDLVVTNELGCPSKISHGPIVIKAPDLFIPNVFSPNGDDSNDEFLVEYNGSQPFGMAIFDRWGVKHFETKNKMAPWKGTTQNGDLVPEGTYYYQVTVGGKDYVGDVTLLR